MNVQSASSAQLVAFYNEHSESPGSIKKFADRKTAERRCQALIEKLGLVFPLAHPDQVDAAYREIAAREAEGEDMSGATVDSQTSAIVKAAPADDSSSVCCFSVHGLTCCPSCGTHLSNGIGEDKQEVNGQIVRHDTNQFACLACGAEFGPAIRRRPAPSADRSAAISLTWQDPDVKAARSERSHVAVGKQTFRSVRDAFVHLGLPLEKHIKFRGQLKAAGTLAYGKHTFTIVAQQGL